ncbi:30S ribosomal protein 3, chloroplastic-like [Andrographis paniculata]|uniref:30S ribosomal protein 3, chloroplastic-like n=1 Tax=Andrographis paniculata TaxID=175694 RepID=UPI0021E6E4CB|nr:30S ribosomal protein 3, chloroplastic-like [Andrographis paniculata]
MLVKSPFVWTQNGIKVIPKPSCGQCLCASPEKVRVVVKVKPMVIGRPRVLLKFIWTETKLGIAMEQVIPGSRGHTNTIPLTPYYYFWQGKEDGDDAWDEELLRRPWISNKHMLLLVNQAKVLINLWRNID